MSGPRETEQISQDDTKYTLDADELIAAALESFDRIVEGDDSGGGQTLPKGGLDQDLDPVLLDDDESYIEVVGLQERLQTRGDQRTAELDLDFEEETPEPTTAPAPEKAPQRPAKDQSAELKDVREKLAKLRQENERLQGELRSARRSSKDQTDAARLIERKLGRKDEALGLLKLERDDLASTLKGWEKMVSEMRSAAKQVEEDHERIRRRHKKELEDIKKLANEKLFKQIIPALDNLELALDHSTTDNQQTVEQVIEGIKMTATHLFKSVEQAGLEQVSASKGEPFDPSFHEAVERVQDASQSADTIAFCLSPGYRLHGRLVRPARVSVYYGGPANPPADPSPSED